MHNFCPSDVCGVDRARITDEAACYPRHLWRLHDWYVGSQYRHRLEHRHNSYFELLLVSWFVIRVAIAVLQQNVRRRVAANVIHLMS